MDENGFMSPQEVEAYRLTQYLRNQQAQQQRTQATSAGPGIGALVGNAAGLYAGSKLLGAGSSAASPTTGALGNAVADSQLAGINALGSSGAGVGSTASVAPVTTAASPTFGTLGAAGPVGLLAGATLLGGKSLSNILKGKKDNSALDIGGRLILGGATMGGSEILRQLLLHESTRDLAKKHTKELLGMSADPAWQAYVNGMRAQYNKAPPDPSKPFAGKYATFDQYKKAGLEAGDLTGVRGNLKTFGPDWVGYGFDRQKQIVQALIDANLYDSKKGEVEITDAAKAQALRDQILKTAAPKATVVATTQAPAINPSTAPIITFTEGVNGTKIPVFAPGPGTLAKYDAINKAKGLK